MEKLDECFFLRIEFENIYPLEIFQGCCLVLVHVVEKLMLVIF